MKHTPGPWSLVYDENGKLELGGGTTHSTGVHSSVGFGIIADVIYKKTNILGDSKKLEYDTFHANAKLVASAPELLEALNDLVFTASKLWDEVKPIKDSDAMTVTHPIIEAAKAAIQKATS